MIDYDYNGIIFQIIPLHEMHIGVYRGRCRNAEYAYWNGAKFIHIRNKFGHEYLEEIHHPENEYRYDVFLPFECVDNNDENVVKLLNAINEKLRKRNEP